MSESKARQRPISQGYQLFMLVLCLYALGALAVQAVVRLEPETREVLDLADYAVCALFLIDFAISFIRAPDRWRYLVTWGWLDILSSVPALEIARWGRAARAVRIFRVLRGIRATRIVATLVLQRRAESTFLAASLIAMLLVISCSIAVLHLESVPDANIKTAEDAVWWAFATITTVGYGDRYPVTSEGRFVAGILMSAGVGLFAMFSGLLAAWFLAPEGQKPELEIAALRKEIVKLRHELEKRSGSGAS